ncbi:MAG: hypothetical protein V4671_16620 [Armatimonadota bacterium]
MITERGLLYRQVACRFLLHLPLYPILFIAALAVTLYAVAPGHIHPFMYGAGQLGTELPSQYMRDQFAYYALFPCWLVLGLLSGVIFRAKQSDERTHRYCLLVFGVWLFCLGHFTPRPPFQGDGVGWLPVTVAYLGALAVCRLWPRVRQV